MVLEAAKVKLVLDAAVKHHMADFAPPWLPILLCLAFPNRARRNGSYRRLLKLRLRLLCVCSTARALVLLLRFYTVLIPAQPGLA